MKNKKGIFYDYALGDQVFINFKDIIQNMDTTKKEPYTITDMFTNGTFRIQCGNINECINILCLEHFFYEAEEPQIYFQTIAESKTDNMWVYSVTTETYSKFYQ